MYLLIDNYDSFTYNLYQYFAEQNVSILIKRNDKVSLSEVTSLNPEKIIISPGPKTPENAGISVNIIKKFGRKTPILGICLGHQCIATAFGAKIKRVNKVLHGKTSLIHHNGTGIFKGLPIPFQGARYHSLESYKLPKSIEITAWSDDNVIMGIKHNSYPITGLQFHPESFLTEHGKKLIQNFIKF
ncbi:MAG: aminodeoxychorismate/anthranilate synthase component II [Candidatus Omnitrophota bacterium]